MARNIRFFLLSILMVAMNLANAQEPKYEVIGFEKTSPADQTAELNPMKDNYGKNCAVFRVVTQNISPLQQKGFYFECDKDVKHKDVMRREQKDNEIWVWVSPGIKQFEIKHDVLGDFTLYIKADYDATVESFDTWKITLFAPQEEPSMSVSDNGLQQQYLGFDINPSDAVFNLFVDGERWHETRRLVSCGKHSYRVEADGYKLYEGEDVVGATPVYIFVPLEAIEGQPKPVNKPVVEPQTVEPQVAEPQVVEPQVKDENFIEHENVNVELNQPVSVEVGEKKEIESQSFLILDGVYAPASYSFVGKSYWAAGLSFGGVKRLGWFLSLMTNGGVGGFMNDGVCDINGVTPSGEIPNYSGEVVVDRWSAMLGGVLRIAKPVYIRIGVGYGVRNVSWKTKYGKTYLNKDLSISGLDASAGLQFHLGGFIILAEAVTTTDFNSTATFEPRVGIGFAF